MDKDNYLLLFLHVGKITRIWVILLPIMPVIRVATILPISVVYWSKSSTATLGAVFWELVLFLARKPKM